MNDMIIMILVKHWPDLVVVVCEEGIWTVNRWPVSDTGVPTFVAIVCIDGVAEDNPKKQDFIGSYLST